MLIHYVTRARASSPDTCYDFCQDDDDEHLNSSCDDDHWPMAINHRSRDVLQPKVSLLSKESSCKEAFISFGCRVDNQRWLVIDIQLVREKPFGGGAAVIEFHFRLVARRRLHD